MHSPTQRPHFSHKFLELNLTGFVLIKEKAHTTCVANSHNRLG